MNSRIIVWVVFLCTFLGYSQNAAKLSGRVFLDANQNKIRDKDEKGLANVLVSNGKAIVKTDALGRYEIKKIAGETVFVIKPSGFQFQLDASKKLPFYVPYDQMEQIENYDFPLVFHNEKKPIKMVLLGDTQVDVIDDVHHVAKLVTEELMDKDIDFIVPLGDLSFDNAFIFKPLSEVLGLIGAPVLYTIGNHDLNWNTTFNERDKSFKSIFGPSYYAFEYGNQLNVVLNTIYPIGNNNYEGRLDKTQLDFLTQLIELEKETFHSIQIFMHIPLEDMKDKEDLISRLKPFENVFVAAGHTHTQYHRYFERKNQKAIHELVAGAVCGSWWQGPHDIDQIPFALMYDGTPKGYWTVSIDEQQYDFKYKVSAAAPEKQINITVPNKKEWDILLNDLNDGFIYANVFAADESTAVSISIDDGSLVQMKKYNGIDPTVSKLYYLQSKGRFAAESMANFPKPETLSTHLWRIEIPSNLSVGAHRVKVKAKSSPLNVEVTGNAVLWIDEY